MQVARTNANLWHAGLLIHVCAMLYIGVLQFTLEIPYAVSLKEKR